jgi:hypothetical protein
VAVSLSALVGCSTGGVAFANDDHLSVFVDFDVVFGEESDAVAVT